MNLEYLFSPTKQFTYPSGKLLDGGKIFVYLKDTTDLATLYSPEGSFVSNPILLDANGRASVRADVTYQYRLEVYTNKDVLLYTCEAFCEGEGSGGFSFVIHDETLSGNGTTSSPLGVFNIPFAVDETMTAYEGIVEGENALVVGVNSAWLNDKLGQALDGKVDRTEFEDCCSAVNEALDNKLDSSAFDLSNYYNKQETNELLDQRVDRYEFAQTMNWVEQTKQDKLEFGYDENSAISSINNSALRGGNGSCPWISGGKEIAEAQTLGPNKYFQVISSFTVSGDHNHFISVKGGIYRFPNEWELGSAIATTNYFMPQSSMSGYLSLIAFSSYTASIDNNLTNNWAYTNSAYSLSLSNFYNKLDASAFSAWSAVQDPVLIGDSNITATSSKVDNHTQWNLAVNATPVVTDTKLVGDNCVTAHTTETSGEWIVGLVQSAYEAIGSVEGISNNVSSLSSDIAYVSANCLTAHQSLDDYYKKTETSSKQEISAALASIQPGDPEVNQVVRTYSAEGKWLIASDLDPYLQKSESGNFYPMTGNPSGFLTAHQSLTGYATTAQVDTVSSLLSAGLDYVSANGGKTYTGVAPIVVNNDEVKISAQTWDLSAGNGISFTDFDELGVTRLDVTGGSDNTAVNQVVQSYSAAGQWLTAHQSLENYYQKTETSSKQEISAALTALNNDLSAAIDYISANGGKTYTGVAPIQVNNTTNKISITGQSLSAGPNIDIFASGGYIVISSYGGNTYCYNFPNGVTSVDLSTFNNYNKVTIVHNNDGMQDYHLYWDGKTKVIPSGLYCEMVKGKDIQNNIKWSFANSGWVNENWWDWD